MAKTAPEKESKKDIRIKKAIDKWLQKGGKFSLAEIQRLAKYSENTVRSGKLNEDTKRTFNEIFAEKLSDDVLLEYHEKLLKMHKIAHQIFPMAVKDDEARATIEGFGFKVIRTNFVKGVGRIAYYSVPDAHAMKDALDMAYKIASKYGATTIKHEFASLSDRELEEELAGTISEIFQTIAGEGTEAKTKRR